MRVIIFFACLILSSCSKPTMIVFRLDEGVNIDVNINRVYQGKFTAPAQFMSEARPHNEFTGEGGKCKLSARCQAVYIESENGLLVLNK